MKEYDQWKNSLVTRGRAKNTIRDYSTDVNMFLNWIKEERKSNEVTIGTIRNLVSLDLDNFLGYLIEKGNLASTRNRRVNAIRDFFKFLYKHEYINKNIAEDLTCAKTGHRERKYIVQEDIDKLLFKVQGSHRIRNLAIIMLLWNTGMRLSEVIDANINDIQDNSIRVIGKGDKERIIPLNKDVINYLNLWLEERAELEYSNEPALFLSTRLNEDYTHRFRPNGIQKMVEGNLKRIGREDCSVHSFRHGFASRLLEKGVDIPTIKKLMGHSNISTTSIYMHVNKEQTRNAVDLLAS